MMGMLHREFYREQKERKKPSKLMLHIIEEEEETSFWHLGVPFLKMGRARILQINANLYSVPTHTMTRSQIFVVM